MPSDKSQKLKDILTILSDSLTKKDFEEAFAKVVDYVKGIDQKTGKELSAIKEAVNTAISRIEKIASEKQTTTSQEIARKSEDALNAIQFKVDALVAEVQKKIDDIRDGKDGEDGLDADEDIIVDKVLKKIPPPIIPKVDILPIEEKIEKLDERISSIRTAPFIGPSRGVFLYINGVKKGLVNSLDIVGSGVATSVVNGLLTITITGGSGGTSIETPTGTINGVNTSFTVSNEPKYIIVDGVSKFSTLHYTYLAGTITITDGAPPTQFIRSVY